MDTDPTALSRMSRVELIEQARGIGIAQPEPLTRAELQDEIVRRSEHDERRRKILRGWFGVARDLVASLVDQGLHLPEAANLIRGSEPPEQEAPRPVSTVTLAEIFAAQGHREKAQRILADVLEVEPEHEVARALHERLLQEDTASAPDPSTSVARSSDGAAPVAAGDTATPAAAPTDAPADEEVLGSEEIIPVERDAAFCRLRNGEVAVYWELSAAGIEAFQQRWPGARPVVQVVVVEPDANGPRRQLHELDLEQALGSLAIEGVGPDAVARAAVGWRSGPAFVPAVVAAELADDDSLSWAPWGHVTSAPALARATALLADCGAPGSP